MTALWRKKDFMWFADPIKRQWIWLNLDTGNILLKIRNERQLINKGSASMGKKKVTKIGTLENLCHHIWPGSFIRRDKIRKGILSSCCIWKILKSTSNCLPPLIQRLWLKTGHWGGPYGAVKAQGSWLSGGCRGNQTKAQPAGTRPHRASMERWQITHWDQLPACSQTKVWSMETGRSTIICSASRTPASPGHVVSL